MTPLGALWFASVFGAALFLAAGYFAALVRRRAVVEAALGEGVLPPWMATDREPDERLATALSERDVARGEADAARHEIETLLAAASSYEDRLAAAAARVRDAEDAVRTAARFGDDSRRKGDEARSLSAKVDDLKSQLDDATRRAAGADVLRNAEEERRELTVRVTVLEGRLREAEHLREENATLRASLRDRALLEERLRAAERQLTAPSGPPPSASSIPRAQPVDGSGREKLHRILASLSAQTGVRSALFADDLGFPVESIGEHAEPLAALSGVLAAAAIKARQLLPLGPAARIVLVDERDVTVTARRHASDWGPLALVTLTQGPAPEVLAPHAAPRPSARPPALPARESGGRETARAPVQPAREPRTPNSKA